MGKRCFDSEPDWSGHYRIASVEDHVAIVQYVAELDHNVVASLECLEGLSLVRTCSMVAIDYCPVANGRVEVATRTVVE